MRLILLFLFLFVCSPVYAKNCNVGETRYNYLKMQDEYCHAKVGWLAIGDECAAVILPQNIKIKPINYCQIEGLSYCLNYTKQYKCNENLYLNNIFAQSYCCDTKEKIQKYIILKREKRENSSSHNELEEFGKVILGIE